MESIEQLKKRVAELEAEKEKVLEHNKLLVSEKRHALDKLRQMEEQVSEFGDLDQLAEMKEIADKVSQLGTLEQITELKRQRDAGELMTESEVSEQLRPQLEAVLAEQDALKKEFRFIKLDAELKNQVEDTKQFLTIMESEDTHFDVDSQGEVVVTAGGVTESLDDFLRQMTNEGKHLNLFKASGTSGGGAQPGAQKSSTPASTYTMNNPFRAETRNLTKQIEVMQNSPALAEQLRREAGLS